MFLEFPENVTIRSSAGPTGVMNEGTQYHLECVVHDVAPVRNLTLRWYKGNETIDIKTFDSDTKEPVDETSVLTFVPSRHDNGVQLRCEAEMQLGPNGPHYLFSEYYPVTVNCKYNIYVCKFYRRECSFKKAPPKNKGLFCAIVYLGP